MTIRNSTTGSSSTSGNGGAIFNSGTLTLSNVTLSGNSALVPSPAPCGACSGNGGAIFNCSTPGYSPCTATGTLTLTNVTLSGNSAPAGAGGGLSSNSTFTLQASIVSNSTGGDCALVAPANLTSKGGSVADDNTCNLTGPNDLPNTNPMLGPLANNGGPTQTMALQPGSPAIDRVPAGLCPPPATDQRGVTRPQGIGCDSGAYEATAAAPVGFIPQPVPVVSPTPTPTPSSTPAPTRTPGATPSPTPTATPGCATVSYAAGYNLVAGPAGTVLSGALGSLFSFQASDTTYETLPVSMALMPPEGYWAFFGSATTVSLPCVTGTSVTVTLPANHFIMVGNPFDRAATVSGAQVVDTFNPTTSAYTTSTGTVTLGTGQGAWVFSSAGGTLTITST